MLKTSSKINSLPFSGNIWVSRSNGLWYITWGQRRKYVKKWERPLVTQNILTSFFSSFMFTLFSRWSSRWLRFRLCLTISVLMSHHHIIDLWCRHDEVSGVGGGVIEIAEGESSHSVCGLDSWCLIVQFWLLALHWSLLFSSRLSSVLPRVGVISTICIGCSDARLILVRMMMRLKLLIVHFARN